MKKINLENVSGNIFFCSDTHFGHTNILKYANRPFKSIQEHDKTLIDSWNKLVGKNDTVFFLGDFAFTHHKAYSDLLNGKIIFLLGNHDDEKIIRGLQRWEAVLDICELKSSELSITLCHYPMSSWNKSFHGSYMCYGHVHSHKDYYPDKLNWDCGVDNNNYAPISLEYLKTIMQSKSINGEKNI